MRRLAGWMFVVGGIVLTIGLGGGAWLVGGALRPVEEIGAAASRIATGQLAERINISETESELGQLASVLNETFARLEAAFAEQKRFTADASHELRTPLAVIIAETQATLTRERSAAEYRETIQTCLDAAQQMRKLAESLLELARFDAGQESLQSTGCDLAELAQGAVSLIRPLAAARKVELVTKLESAPFWGDVDRVTRVITNLLDNAIFYNVEGGQIRVRTRVENGFARLDIADTGRGLAAEDLARIFERFYRADKARSSTQGRSGLGLAISKAIVDAHRGEISVSSTLGEGSTFTVRLPR